MAGLAGSLRVGERALHVVHQTVNNWTLLKSLGAYLILILIIIKGLPACGVTEAKPRAKSELVWIDPNPRDGIWRDT
jgi:hypothetical protein